MQINYEIKLDTGVLEDLRVSLASAKRTAAAISVFLPSRRVGKSRIMAAAIESARESCVSVVGPDGDRFRNVAGRFIRSDLEPWTAGRPVTMNIIDTYPNLPPIPTAADFTALNAALDAFAATLGLPVTIEDASTIRRRAARRRQRLARRITRQHRTGTR